MKLDQCFDWTTKNFKQSLCLMLQNWALIHWAPTWIAVFTKQITLLFHKCPHVYIFTNKLSCAINQFSSELKVWVWGAQWFAILLYVSSHQLIEADTAYKIKIKHLDLALALFMFCLTFVRMYELMDNVELIVFSLQWMYSISTKNCGMTKSFW